MNGQLAFRLIDAFASEPLTGNPCAVILGADALSDAQMLAISKEMNQSETAFLMTPLGAPRKSSSAPRLRARYFTPEREIPLAGHPTIAAVHAAVEAGLLRIEGPRTWIELELIEGPIRVEIQEEGGRQLIRMFQRKPVFGEFHEPGAVLPIFGLSATDLLEGHPVQTVSTGTKQLMVPLRSQAALRKLAMNPAAYRAYRDKAGFFSPHFFCLEGVSADARTFARHLGTPPDTLEDAFTGSATGAMAAYLWQRGLLENPRFIAEQGHWMGRPGRAWVEVSGPREDIRDVSVAGTAVTVVRGTLSL
jgi:trans-2,3-dihydro-3-hydroxyanthranilate isomerase